MKKIDLFFCSKPLQYLNARNIPILNNGHKKVLLIVLSFYKADEFVENLKGQDSHWDEIVSFKRVSSAYLYILFHRVKNLYISYDNGTLLAILYHLKRFNLYMLEEGAATYLDIYFRKNKIKKMIDHWLGASDCWGHSSYLKGAYVYYPELYKAKKKVNYNVLSFVTSYLEAIRSQYSLFVSISSVGNSKFLDIHNKRILIYVTDWVINNRIVEKMFKELDQFDKVYVKPHPNIKSENIDFPEGIEVLRTNLMIEFVFFKWFDNNNEITVYHEGSSGIFYFNEYVKSYDLSDNRDSDYNLFVASHKTM